MCLDSIPFEMVLDHKVSRFITRLWTSAFKSTTTQETKWIPHNTIKTHFIVKGQPHYDGYTIKLQKTGINSTEYSTEYNLLKSITCTHATH